MSDQAIDLINELRQRVAAIDGVAARFDIDGESVSVGDGEPQAVLSMTRESLAKLDDGRADPATLFMTGELKIEGDMNAALALGEALNGEAVGGAVAATPVPAASVNPNIAYLDNVGLIVLDLDATRQAFETLGFNCAERGTHFYEKPEGVFTKWGTANHCVNFRDGGLLEFIAHFYPEHPAGLYGQQLEQFGNHWGKITVHCSSSDAEVERLRRQGHPTAEPAVLYRYTDGEEFRAEPGHSKRTALFSYPTSFNHGFMTVGAEHSLGEFPISEAHFQHPNGAQRMPFVLVGCKDLTATIESYEDSLSVAAQDWRGARRIPLGRDTYIVMMAKEQLPEALSEQLGSRSVACLGAGFDVRDLDATRSYLESRSMFMEQTPLGWMIAEPIAGSGAIFFNQQ
ncbi:MAG: VOC family protein [Pseudomonadota bacterium]